MIIRTRPASDAYREGWERTFGSKVVDFDKAPRICWCSRCRCLVQETDVICESCGASLGPTGDPMVVTSVNRENRTVTFNSVAKPSKDDYVFQEHSYDLPERGFHVQDD